VVSRCYVMHFGAHRLDHARAFVAQDAGRTSRECAGGLRQVGVAYAAGSDPHPNLVGRNRCERNVLDAQRISDRAKDGTAFDHGEHLNVAEKPDGRTVDLLPASRHPNLLADRVAGQAAHGPGLLVRRPE
jgi:hypothetical protein